MSYLFLLFLLQSPQPSFQDPASGLEVTFPEGWNVTTQLPAGTALLRATNDTHKWLATCATNESNELNISHLKFSVQKMGVNAKELVVSEVKAQSFEAFQAVWVNFQLTMPPKHTINYRIYSLSNGHHAFYLVFAARPQNFDQLVPVMEQILATIQFVGKTNALAKKNLPDLASLEKMKDPASALKTKELFAAIQAKTQDLSVYDKLLKEGADVNGLGLAGTPLAQAVREDQRPLVLWLLDHGADLHHPGNDEKGLYTTASLPIQLLLKSRYKALAENKEQAHQHDESAVSHKTSTSQAGINPTQDLMEAITSGNVDKAEKAIAAGADVKENIPGYGLNALALTQQMIKQLEPLRLDTEPWKQIAERIGAARAKLGL